MAQLVIPVFTKKFKKQFKKLPLSLQKRFDIKLAFLLTNPLHPSLRARKMGGVEIFEARLTKHYRFTYQLMEDKAWFLTVGPHDEGLGKK